MKLKLHIERLLVDGLPGLNGDELRAAVTLELQRHLQLAETAKAVAVSRAEARIQARDVSVRKGQSSRQLGAAVARSAARALEMQGP